MRKINYEDKLVKNVLELKLYELYWLRAVIEKQILELEKEKYSVKYNIRRNTLFDGGFKIVDGNGIVVQSGFKTEEDAKNKIKILMGEKI